MDSDSSHTTEVTVEAEAWRSAVTDPEGLVRRAVAAALGAARAPLPAAAEVSVLLADDGRVAGLNRDWRGKDRPTNVLSFPAFGPDELAALAASGGAPPGDGPVPLGDVAVALETVLREAEAEAKTPADHLAHLVVHGTLHLLGHDHGSGPEAEAMEALEVGALARIGVADPYRGEAPDPGDGLGGLAA